MSVLDAAPRGGLVVILSAPSGCGKSTLAARLLKHRPDLRVSISHTTRAPRGREVDGQAYHFVDSGTFQEMVEADGFLEHAVVYGESYGTSRAEIDRIHADGCHALLDIDTQGGHQVATRLPGVVSVFILPPSMVELERRLRDRKTDSEEKQRLRLSRARDEIRLATTYQHVIVNDDLDAAAEELLMILGSEERRASRMEPVVNALLTE